MLLLSKLINFVYNVINILLAPLIKYFNKLKPTKYYYLRLKKNIYIPIKYTNAFFFKPTQKEMSLFINKLISLFIIRNILFFIPALYYALTTKIIEISDKHLLSMVKNAYGSYVTRSGPYYVLDLSMFKNKSYYPKNVYNCGTILYFTDTELSSIHILTDDETRIITNTNPYWKIAKLWMTHNFLVFGVIGVHVRTHRSLLPITFITSKLDNTNPLFKLLKPHIKYHTATQFKFYVADMNNVVNEDHKGLDNGNLFGNYSLISNPVGIKIESLFEISTNIILKYQLKYANTQPIMVNSILNEIMIAYQEVYKIYITKFVDLYYDFLTNDSSIQDWKNFCIQYCEEFPEECNTKDEWIEILTCCICKFSVFHSIQHILIYQRENIINMIPFRMRLPVDGNVLDLSKYVWKIDLFQHYLFRESEGKSLTVDDITNVDYDLKQLKVHEHRLKNKLKKLRDNYSQILDVKFNISQSIHV
jgi:hypothetical protein